MIDLTLLHTTILGEDRIRRNLNLPSEIDVVDFCKSLIENQDANITRNGKNWYVQINRIHLTINATSHTLITAHRK